MKWPLILIIGLQTIYPSNLAAVEEIIELPPQKAKCVCGVAEYPDGSPLRGGKVEEFDATWKNVLRSAETDSSGHFQLPTIKGHKTYHVRISARESGFNPVQMAIEVSRFKSKLLVIRLHVA